MEGLKEKCVNNQMIKNSIVKLISTSLLCLATASIAQEAANGFADTKIPFENELNYKQINNNNIYAFALVGQDINSLDVNNAKEDFDQVLFECITEFLDSAEEFDDEKSSRQALDLGTDVVNILNNETIGSFDCVEGYQQKLFLGLKHKQSVATITSNAKQLMANAQVPKFKLKNHRYIFSDGFGGWFDNTDKIWTNNGDPVFCSESANNYLCTVRQIETDQFGRISGFWEVGHNVSDQYVKNKRSYTDFLDLEHLSAEIEYNPSTPSFDISQEKSKPRKFWRFTYSENGDLEKITSIFFYQTKRDKGSDRWFLTDNDFFNSNEVTHPHLKRFEISLKSNIRHGTTTLYKESVRGSDMSLVPYFLTSAHKIDWSQKDELLFTEAAKQTYRIDINFKDGLPDGKVTLYWKSKEKGIEKLLHLKYRLGKLYIENTSKKKVE